VNPARFGRYEVEALIGRGGMGAVYRAQDPRFRRTVAIKVLSRHLLSDDQFRVRFDREARVVAALEHPAIVPVYDYGEEDGEPYLVFRYMEGGNLAERIAREGPLPVEVVAALTRRLADALDHAHGEGVIHRDVKPANVVFDRNGNAYLTDFGIAAMTVHTVSLTGLGTIGSPGYMSPEQCEGKPATAASDIYSLGCTVYEALTGRAPFQAENPMALLLKHIREEPPLVSALRGGVPVAVAAAVSQALAKEPGIRAATAGALADAFAAPEPPVPAPEPEPEPGPRRDEAGGDVTDEDATAPLDAVTRPVKVPDEESRDIPPEPEPAPLPVVEPAKGRGGGRTLLVGGIAALVAVAGGLGLLALGLFNGDPERAENGSERVTPTSSPAAVNAGFESLPPTSIPAQVSAGFDFTCAIETGGALSCWGDDSEGQSSPPDGTFRSLSSGPAHACAVRNDDGAAICWGRGDDGQTNPQRGPFLSVSAGDNHTCGILTDRRALCWGGNQTGQATPPTGEFADLNPGSGYTCGKRPNQTIVCWGRKDVGISPTPGAAYQDVAVFSLRMCALVAVTGEIVCWGLDLGDDPPRDATFSGLTIGISHACALNLGGEAVCWGDNTAGRATPPAGARFSSISAGALHTCGVLESGGFVCWGRNDSGQATVPPSLAAAAAPPPTAVPAVATASPGATIAAGAATYTVKPGDTCFSISVATLVTQARLIELNPSLGSECKPTAGQVLRLR
jgi:serine/threonine protein kinase, bacterial